VSESRIRKPNKIIEEPACVPERQTSPDGTSDTCRTDVEGIAKLASELKALKARQIELEAQMHLEREHKRRREGEVSALLAGARAVLQYRQFADSAQTIFDNCKQLLGATSGYIALLSDDGTENEVLFLDSGGRVCTVDPGLPMPIRALRGEVYRSGKVMYRNDFSRTRWVRYLPQGHVELDNVLFAPLSLEGKVVGLLGLANKPGGFDRNDARMAATFGELAAIALRNSRTLGLLEGSETELSAILANVPVLTLVLDPDRRVVKANKAAAAFAGRGVQEMVGVRGGGALGCLHSVDDPRGCGFGQSCQACGLRLTAVDTLETGNSHYRVEWHVRIGRDGKTEEMAFLLTTVLLNTPRKQLLVCLEDITERQKAEAALRESELKYRGVFEHMSEAMVLGEIVLDQNGDPYDFRILDMNESWGRLADLNAEKTMGKTRREVLPVIDPFFIEVYGKVALTGEPAHFERFSPVMGKWLEVRAFSPRKGQFVQLISDVTERKKTEVMKDEFIGMVSHEIKTPLTVVTGAINTAMSEGIAPEEARSLLEDAAWAAETMADIVENLLELSRWQANRLVLLPGPLDIGQVVSRLVERSSKRSAAHRIVVDVPPDLPMVNADRTRIERVLDNLIDNAIKYSPNGGEVRVAARQESGNILLSVRDEGIGIASADSERLFQPFARLETVVPGSSIQGVGLGLVVCRRLVEAHGGRIWVESEPGKGSTFYFALPLKIGTV
jgi:signal transduction histidine kinase